MPAAGRSRDQASIEQDSHGCPCCPHGTSGAAAVGSGDVLVNGSKALRLGDQGTHGGCCGSSSWRAAMGWSSVLVNGKPIHCQGDATEHCGGIGALSTGSPDVIVGDWASRGGGGRGSTIFQLQIGTPMFLQVPIKGVYVSPSQTIATIAAFRHGLEAGLMSIAGQAAQLAARYGVGRLLRLVDHVWAPLGSILERVVGFFGDYIPGISELLRYARVLVQSVLANIILYGWRAARKDGPCPPKRPVGPPLPVERLKLGMLEEALFVSRPPNVDVSGLVDGLLRAFRPVFVEHPDDHRALRMEELLQHSRLEPLHEGEASSPRSLSEYLAEIRALEEENQEALEAGEDALGVLNIDEWFARDPGWVPMEQRVYYGRAIKCSNLKIVLHYFALRSGSFFPNSYIDQAMFGHEGDGEGVRVIIRRRSEADPWLLAGPLFMSKHYTRNCSCGKTCEEKTAEKKKKDDTVVERAKKELQRKTGCIDCKDCEDPFLPNDMMNVACEVDDETKRPIVYISIGAHAMGPTSGPRWAPLFSIDHYPEISAETRVVDYQLVSSAEPNVRETVFTRRVIWGKKELFDPAASPGHGEIPTGEPDPPIEA